MELNLLYVHSRSIGYGRLGVCLADELERMGVTIHDHLPVPPEADQSKAVMAHFNDAERNAGVSNVTCWVSTPTHASGWYAEQVPTLFSMWEATLLPEQFRETLHNFDRVLVPSEQNVELFSHYHRDVRLVPLGIDPAVWHYQPRQPPTTEFRFLIGGSGPRKGTDLARKAFRAAFPSTKRYDTQPVLIAKSPKGEEELSGPNIRIIGGRISDEEEVALYGFAHCYLQPSRGEGFGLQPLQAMAQGLPTILTNAHGHADFAHLGIPLDYEMKPSAYFIYGEAGDWWEPDFDQLVDSMRWVYENYDEACVRAEESAAVVARDWTWHRSAETFLDALGRDRLVPYAGSREWFKPEAKRYLLITNRDWTADIAGTTYFFEQGKRYWEQADVKRILYEGGILDTACLTVRPGETIEDLGLVEPQARQLAEYTAARSWCPTCHQQLGSGLTKADAIYEELSA